MQIGGRVEKDDIPERPFAADFNLLRALPLLTPEAESSSSESLCIYDRCQLMYQKQDIGYAYNSARWSGSVLDWD